MARIDELRQQPEYAGLDDEGIVATLSYQYPEVPREKIAADLGVQAAAAPSPGRTVGTIAKDLGASAMSGAVAVPETIVGLGDMVSHGGVGKWVADHGVDFKGAHDYWNDKQSDATKADQAAVQNADGFVDKLGAAVTHPMTIATSVAESLPAMALGGLAGRGLVLASRPLTEAAVLARAGTAGAVGEGLTMMGQDAEQIRQESKDGHLTDEQIGHAGAIGATGAAFSILGARMAQELGIHDVHTMMAAGAVSPAARKGLVRRVLEGAFSEGVLEELPQSVVEQIYQNKANGRPIDEGVDQAAVMGLLAGAAMGAGGNVPGGHAPKVKAGPETPPDAGAATTPAGQPQPLLPGVPDPAAGPLSAAASITQTAGVGDRPPPPPEALQEAINKLVEPEKPADPKAAAESQARREAIAAGVVPTPMHPAIEDDPFDFSKKPAIQAPSLSDRDAQIYAETTGSTATDVVPASDLDKEAHQAAPSPLNDRPEPTPAQKEAGNYKKGHIDFQGLPISIENPQGSTRKGLRPDGTEWSHEMSNHYGYIKRTVGADDEQVDVYVGPRQDADTAYIIDQAHQHDLSFDEHKVMLGFASRGAAVNAYRSNFDKGWVLGRVTEMPMEQFKAWLKEGDLKKPAHPKGQLNVDDLPAAIRNQRKGATSAIDTQPGSAAPAVAPAVQPSGTDTAGVQPAPPAAAPAPVPGVAGQDAAAAAAPAPAPAAPAAQPAGQPVGAVAQWEAMTRERRRELVAKTKAKPAALDRIPSYAWANLSPGWKQAIEKHLAASTSKSAQHESYRKWIEANPGPIPAGMRETIRMDTRLNDGEAEDLLGQNAPAGPVVTERLQSAHTGGVRAGSATDSIAAAAPVVPGQEPGSRQASAAPPPAAVAATVPQNETPEAPPSGGKPAAPPSGNTIFTDDAAEKARARLKAKLGRLGSGIDPEMLMDGLTLAGWHVEKGARSFGAFVKSMVGDLGEGVRPYLKSWYMAMKYDPRAASFAPEMSSTSFVEEFDVATVDAPAAPVETVKDKIDGKDAPTFGEHQAVDDAKAQDHSLTRFLAERVDKGEMPKDNPALKRLVALYDRQDPTPERMKQAQEHLEAAIVMRARLIASMNRSQDATRNGFDQMLALYESQPNLNVRTSTSVENQAYSTPAPLAFLASRLTDIDKTRSVLEPTAGTGMLLMEASPKNATVNEINPERAQILQEQGFRVSQKDAATESLRHAGHPVDRVITNPPFGSVKNDKGEPIKVPVDGYKLGQIDHLIAARALETMKDDGRATLILGANKIAGGQNEDDRIFFNWLYSHYNVTSHFEVDGKLYTRQGAGWPVRVITIHGRQASDKIAPQVGTIQRVDSWEGVYGQFQQALAASGQGSERGAAPGPGGADAQQSGNGSIPGPVGGAAAAAGGRGPRGGATRTGDVAGERPGAVGDSGVQQPGRVGAGDRTQRHGAEPAAESGLDAAGNAQASPGDKPARGAGAAALDDADNQFQTKYIARSSRKDDGVLIPVNMAQPLQDALSNLEDKVGDLDEYAAKELGYDSTEKLHEALMGLQVDSVAASIYQIKNGKGLIIADQTGIGKGRQAAAIIRWAVKAGHTPVFFTVKPSLFTDMYVEDLRGIFADGMVKPFVMNTGEPIKDHDGTVLNETTAADRARAYRAMAGGKMPGESNALFVTYSQINKENAQRTAITNIASNAVFILDESHNAGGESGTGEFVRAMLDLGKGVVYLSATYAKRPDNMPLYYKTDMGEAVTDNDTLLQAMESGGLPLQTVVSNNLVKAGQMFRRERSYAGISIVSTVNTKDRAAHEKLADATTEALRAITAADKAFHTTFFAEMQKSLAEAGEAAIDNAGNQAEKSVDHTEFSSVVHNFVRQLLLGLNVNEVADKAISSIKAGQKPVIALDNTMGSFLNEYAGRAGLSAGDPMGDYDYRQVLTRALERSRAYTVKDKQGNKSKVYVSLEQLDPVTRAAYDAAQGIIDRLDVDVPASPIDWIRMRLKQAGYSVAEVTGRHLAVDYTDPKKPRLSEVPAEERTDKTLTTRRFNGIMQPPLDAIILNVSGSTGISLHASEKFPDQRPRQMIVAQAAQDINILMQMLGRVHRTGQVVLPGYEFINPDLPAVIRPQALTSKKMKSLNANTSSNTESATSVEAVDILNKYGDQIVTDYLRENRRLALDMGLAAVLEGDGVVPDTARKATGRLALMPVTLQKQFYDEVEQQYRTLIEYLNKTNQNELEPKTFDFDAKELKSEVLFEGTNPDSPFGQDAVYGEYSIKAQGKPMKPAEIDAAMAKHLGGIAPEAHANRIIAGMKAGTELYLKSLDEHADLKSLATETVREGIVFIREHAIGSKFRVDINGDQYNAIVLNIKGTWKEGKAGNPFGPSKIHVTVAVNGGLRQLTLAATQFRKIETSRLPPYYSVKELFNVAEQGREVAKIVTGNLLGAYGEIKGVRGAIISFSKQDGSSELGILLPKAFSMSENALGGYRLRSGADAVKFLHQSNAKDIDKLGIASRDNAVRITPASAGGITIRVPKSKAKGGKYFLDKHIRAVTGDFTTVGDRMVANVPAGKAAAAVDAIAKKVAIYAMPSHAEAAREMFGDKPAFRQSGSTATVPTAAHTAKIQNVADLARAAWKNAPEIVVGKLSEAPAALREEARQRVAAGGQVPGAAWANGKVYLFTDRIANEQEAAKALFHEGLGHMGLNGVFGESLTPILRQIAMVRRAEVSRILKRTGLGESQRLQAAEELLAEMAERTPSLGFVQRAIAAIKTFLRKAGLLSADKLSDGEIIRDYILPAREWVINGDKEVGELRAAPAFSQPEGRTVQVDGVRRPESNSLGQPIYPMTRGMQGIINFWRWFGDSKVVDDKGRPLVVYHGTKADFSRFNTNPSGLFFAAGADVASRYAKWSDGMTADADADTLRQFPDVGKDGGANVMPVYLSIKSPLTMTPIEFLKGVTDGGINHYMEGNEGLAKRGYDGLHIMADAEDADWEAPVYVAFKPSQIKSATGNNGGFDASNSDIRFSQSPHNTVDDYWKSAMGALNEYRDTPGKLNWWQKTFGTPYDLAQRHPKTFGRVYDKVQEFLRDVSLYATEAADMAPRILPKLDTWRDAFKSPVSAKDTKAIQAPVFEGTVKYARDRTTGKPILVKDLEERFAPLDVHARAQMLLGADAITAKDLERMRAQPIEHYESYINSRFEQEFMSAGIVWTDAELRSMFKLSDQQIELYRETRAAIDKSLSAFTLSHMLNFAGKDARPIADQVMAAKTIEEGSNLLSDYLMSLEESGTPRSKILTDTAGKVVGMAQRGQRLIDRGYAPLSRFGRYTVDVVDAKGERQFFGMYEGRMEARRAAAAMRDLFPGATIERGTSSQQGHELYRGMSPDTAELFGEMMGLDAMGETRGDLAFQKFLKEVKAPRSAMKRLIERKGVAGYSEDVGRVLASFIYSNARQTSNNLHAKQIAERVGEIDEKTSGQGELKDAAVRLMRYVMDPTEEAVGLRQMLFAQYLGGSVAAMLVNMTQPFAVTAPYLTQWTSISKVRGLMAGGIRDVWKKETGDKALDAALKHAVEQGIVAPQEVHQLMRQGQGKASLIGSDGTVLGSLRAGAANTFERAAFLWGQPFAIAELFNRRLTFIAAFRLATEQGMPDPAAFAEKAITDTQFSYNKGNKPEWARGPVGSLLFTFKQYSISYLELVHRMYTQGGPEGKRAALYMLAMLMMMGGAGGLPFMDDVSDLIDGIGQRLGYNLRTKRARQKFLENVFGETLGGLVDRGVTGLPGMPVDVSSRFGMGNLIPGTGLLTKKTDHARDVVELLGPAGDMASRVFQGAGMAADGKPMQGLLEMAPKAIGNVQKAIQMETLGYYPDAKGNKVIDTNTGEAIAKAIGFQPLSVSSMQEASRDVQQLKAVAQMRETEIADKWAQGLFKKDPEATQSAKDELVQWNRDNPESKIVIKPQQIRSRLKSMRESKEERLVRTSPKEIRAQVKAELAEARK